MDSYFEIGKKIKELRKEAGYTQGVLAEKIGITKSAISAYENATRNPSYAVLLKITEAFHLSLDNFFGRYETGFVIPCEGLTVEQVSIVSKMIDELIRLNRGG